MSKQAPALLAVFCTDIEGSSARRRRFGDEAMDAALAKHNRIIEDAVSEFGGQVFKLTGDGVYAVFSNPLNGIRAAISAQRAISTSSWEAVGGLFVRIVVNFGSATESNGDYLGKGVNRAGKLLHLAHGGQILLTEETKAVVRADDSTVELRKVGAAVLDDPAQLVEIHQVVAPGIQQDFPPLRSARLQIPNEPVRTPDGRVYRVKRRFNQADEREFRAAAFRVFQDCFRERIGGLSTVPGINASMEDLGAHAFTCTVVNHGHDRGVAHITVRRGSADRFAMGDISYSFEENARPDTTNGWLSIEADEYELYLRASFGLDMRERLSPAEAAELLWDQFVERAEISHGQNVKV